jgi:hypothetical protein
MSLRMMFRLLVAVGVGGGCAADGGNGGGGGGSAAATGRQVCEQAMAAMCHAFYTCLRPDELSALGYPASQEACATQLSGQAGCAQRSTQNPCPGTLVFHQDQADLCLQQLRNVTCDQLNGNSSDPGAFSAACGKVCS